MFKNIEKYEKIHKKDGRTMIFCKLFDKFFDAGRLKNYVNVLKTLVNIDEIEKIYSTRSMTVIKTDKIEAILMPFRLEAESQQQVTKDYYDFVREIKERA